MSDGCSWQIQTLQVCDASESSGAHVPEVYFSET